MIAMLPYDKTKGKKQPYPIGSPEWLHEQKMLADQLARQRTLDQQKREAGEKRLLQGEEIPLPSGDTATQNPVDIEPVTYEPDYEDIGQDELRKELLRIRKLVKSNVLDIPQSNLRYDLLNVDDFVRITDGSETFFGGNQDWFEEEEHVDINGITYPGSLIAFGGCANSAAVNTMIYMGVVPFDGTKKCYQEIAKEMLNYFSPIIISGYNYVPDYPIIEKEQENDATFDWDFTLGVPFLKTYADGVVSFAKDQNVELKANIAGSNTAYEDAVSFVEEALDKGKPVSMLILFNKYMKDVPVAENVTADFKPHWMIITGLEKDPDTGDVFIDIVSWGKKYAPFPVPFEKIWNHTYGNKGLVYFEESEK